MSDALDAYVGRGGIDNGGIGGHQGEQRLREDEHHGGQHRIHAEGDEHTRPHAVCESGLILLDLTHEEEQGEDDGLAEDLVEQVHPRELPRDREGILSRQLAEEEHADGGVDRGGKAEDQEGGEELVVDVPKGLFEFGKHGFSFLR